MKNLLEQLKDAKPEAGHFALCHLGQQSFLVKIGDRILAFDPYLTPDRVRLVPPFFTPEEFRGIDIITGSHDHGDHIDRPSLSGMAAASPQAKLVIPEAVRSSIDEFPQDRIAGLDDGVSVEIGGVRITAVAEAHEFLDRNPAGHYPYLGYVVEYNGVTLYHAGDCCLYEGFTARLRQWRFDAMFLPINGRDAGRYTNNCIGCLTFQEAADLAGALKPRMVFPAHYDMFAMNLENPQQFLAYVRVKYPDLKTELPPTGQVRLC